MEFRLTMMKKALYIRVGIGGEKRHKVGCCLVRILVFLLIEFELLLRYGLKRGACLFSYPLLPQASGAGG